MGSPEGIITPERETKSQIAFGAYYPENVLTNEEIESWGVETVSGDLLTASSIKKKTGVERRFIATNEDVVSMGLKAVETVINKVDSQFDFVIFTTTYPTGQHFSTIISYFIRSHPFNTLDIYSACSSFVAAFDYLKEYESWFDNKRVLIIASEKISPTLPNLKNGAKDKSLSQTIFSDGAAAVSFVYGRDLKILSTCNHQFNLEETRALRMPINYDLIADAYKFGKVKWNLVPPSKSGKVEMDGKVVYEAAVKIVPGLITEAIFEAGLKFSDVNLVIPHQASRHMISGIAKRLSPVISSKIVYDLQEGNFSSASIPKAWMEAQSEGRIKSGDKVVLASVGAGLSANAAVVEIG